MNPTRRAFLKTAAAAGAGLAAAQLLEAESPAGPPAAKLRPSGGGELTARLNRFPGGVQEFLIARERAAKQLADEQRAKLQTAADANRYIMEAKRKISQCFGPLPTRCPLKARITGSLERAAYRIEKIIFESRPGFLVTANLYLPKGEKRARPGVIGACGHWPEGKAALQYQAFAQGLARQGYVVLIFDPAGQGERVQYLNDRFQGTKTPGGVAEHLQAGNQQYLVGEFFGAWRAWDGIRALDYLLSRPEVDPARIGVTGNSGGGTETTWLCALDPRWSMAAPVTFITTFLHNLENELPTDTEQCPPSAIALGLDQWDFLAVMAPKPVVLLGVEKDFFDVRGLEEAYGQLHRLYALLGKEDNLRLFVDNDYHNYTKGHRAAVYDLFNHASGLGPPAAEPELSMEKTSDLWCTPQGQVGALGSRTIFSYTAEKSRLLKKERRSVEPNELSQMLRGLLRLEMPEAAPHYRILRPVESRRYPKKFAGSYVIETENHPLCAAYRLSDFPLLSRPPRVGGRALLYVSHESADGELRASSFVAELCRAESQAAIFACDVRGIGELEPKSDLNDPGTLEWANYLHASHALMLARPYLGQKTFDVLQVIRWLSDCGHNEIHLAADGWGALPAIFAAILSDKIVQVTLRRALTSYSEIAENKEYRWPLWSLLPGVLQHFDLEDCYRALQRKNLNLVEPWGAIRAGKDDD